METPNALQRLADLDLDRALRPTLTAVLLHLADGHKVVSVRELATALGLTPSTTARHLRELHARGILTTTPAHRHDQLFELHVELDPITAPASNPTTTSRDDAGKPGSATTGPDSIATAPNPRLEPPEEEPLTPTPDASPETPAPHAARDATGAAVRAAAEPLETPQIDSSRDAAQSSCESTDFAIAEHPEADSAVPERPSQLAYGRIMIVVLLVVLSGLELMLTHLPWGVLPNLILAWLLAHQPRHPAPPPSRH